MLRNVFLLLISIISMLSVTAQDLHYSQFNLNPMHLSPAATGVFNGDMRASVQYRSQWKTVPVAYETYSGAFEWKAIERVRNIFSLGLQLQQDKAGDAGLSWLQVGANIGMVQAINQNNAISVGFGVALAQRSFNINGLKFKNQWAGDYFDPGLPTGESFNRASGLAPTLSTGILWHYAQIDTRTRLDVGAGAAHLNKPVVSLGDFGEKLNHRISCFANSYIQINEWLDGVVLGEWQGLTHAKEWLFGAGIRRILTTGLANETSVQCAFAYRIGDAIIPSIQVERNNWTLGLSYDWNISAFDTATRGRGGIEIAAIWRRIPVPLPSTVKSCPPF